MVNRNQNPFLNTAAAALTGVKCGISNKNFWPSVTEAMKQNAAEIQHLPKAETYRSHLEKYLYKRVQIVSTKGWNIVEQNPSRTRLCLNDAMLIFASVKRHQSAEELRVPTGHMHIHVDNNWMRFVDPQPNEDLLVNGVLYEYKNAQGFRNIGILPVIVTPIKNHHKNYKKSKKKKS